MKKEEREILQGVGLGGDQVEKIIEQYGVQAVIDTLSPLITENRRSRIDYLTTNRLYSLKVAIECPYDIHNALAVVRSGDAFGIPHIHIIKSELNKSTGKETTQGAWRWTFVHRHSHFEEFFQDIKKEGFCLAGASLHNSLSLEELPLDKPLCLLFGNEHRGISSESLKLCDYKFSIPMHGMVESLNLSAAAAITLYTMAKRKRDFLKRSGDLTDKQQQYLKAIYYIRSLGSSYAFKYLKASMRQNRFFKIPE
jgi:tRNA (guanosine-2'-O-)-methyltransferase